MTGGANVRSRRQAIIVGMLTGAHLLRRVFGANASLTADSLCL